MAIWLTSLTLFQSSYLCPEVHLSSALLHSIHLFIKLKVMEKMFTKHWDRWCQVRPVLKFLSAGTEVIFWTFTVHKRLSPGYALPFTYDHLLLHHTWEQSCPFLFISIFHPPRPSISFVPQVTNYSSCPNPYSWTEHLVLQHSVGFCSPMGQAVKNPQSRQGATSVGRARLASWVMSVLPSIQERDKLKMGCWG